MTACGRRLRLEVPAGDARRPQRPLPVSWESPDEESVEAQASLLPAKPEKMRPPGNPHSSDDELPRELARFLDEHLHTPEQLEALLHMARSSGRLMSPDALAEELGLSVTAATIALTRLSSHQLLISRIGVPAVFEYKPATAALSKLVDELLSRYQSHRLQVISQLTANAARRAQSADLEAFAAAFIVRGKKG